MLAKESRKESIRRFKEQKPGVGIYAVRCTATGHVWVGATKNLAATNNRCWFALRNGMQIDRPLQEEWNLHGEPSFEYEILECLPEDAHPLEIDRLLKERMKDWVSRLHALPLR